MLVNVVTINQKCRYYQRAFFMLSSVSATFSYSLHQRGQLPIRLQTKYYQMLMRPMKTQKNYIVLHSSKSTTPSWVDSNMNDSNCLSTVSLAIVDVFLTDRHRQFYGGSFHCNVVTNNLDPFHGRKPDGVTSCYPIPQDGGANRTKVGQSIYSI